MSDLKVTERGGSGRDRLYVETFDGLVVAWLDRVTGKLTVIREEHRAAVLEVLAPYLPQPNGHPAAKPRPKVLSLTPLTPADDLALNRPGASLKAKLDAEGPGPVDRLITWLLRRDSEWTSWRRGLVGERRVGAELDRLSNQGWHVLHSILLPNSVDIDHLLIGPGGVFNINTKHCPDKNVWVGNDSVRVNHGPPRPYTRKVRAEAHHVQGVLARYSGRAVHVQPALVFVGVSDLKTASTLSDVRVWRQREVASLGPVTGELTPGEAETLYAIARHRRAWTEA
ncbi:nuclease-related domain-containing protein [Streptomyces sp. NPDC053048]|uniref:nuclease-related domain-containing protein n=1 Tax=Streptomyces sp. NPDC053048 TaxID=3365694 RepID=UPI0037CD8D23